MYGLGILKSFSVTLRRFLMTYVDDIRYLGRRYRPENIPARQSPGGRGIFTVQYPKERLPLPENFRMFPFQVLDPETGKVRCTACGICVRTCPTQCIWIVRATDLETGKPKREPAEFHIDVSICMSCGLCAEFCPFDALKMDHDYEVADYKRTFLWDLDRLAKPLAYHAEIHPTEYAAEQAARERKAAKKK
jgi:NADH-quinone oxidoreductase subunit I